MFHVSVVPPKAIMVVYGILFGGVHPITIITVELCINYINCINCINCIKLFLMYSLCKLSDRINKILISLNPVYVDLRSIALPHSCILSTCYLCTNKCQTN